MRNAVFYSILIIGFLTSGMISAQGKQRQMEALDRGLVAVKRTAVSLQLALVRQ